MPIYEYRCGACQRRFSVLTLRASERPRPKCPRCDSKRAERLMSRFAMPKSDEARLDRLADPGSLGDLDENDPRSMGKWMRKMGKEVGEEFASSDFEEMVDEMEQGGAGGDDGDGNGDEL